MTFLVGFLMLAILVQGGLFFYSYKMKKKSKRDDVLVKYRINTRSELFSAICRNDLPKEDMKKLNSIYSSNKEV